MSWDGNVIVAGILLGSRASQGERQPPQSGWFHPGAPDT